MKRLAFNSLLFMSITLALIFFASNTIHAPDETTVAATYQEYENGFMLWRADRDCVYIFANNNIIILPDAENNYTYCNAGDFATLLANDALSLGTPQADAINYTFSPMTLTDPATGTGGPYNQFEMPLPDGRLLWCGVRAATAGTCHLDENEGN